MKTIAAPYQSFKKYIVPVEKVNNIKKEDKTYAQADKLQPFILKSEGGLAGGEADRASQNYCPTPLKGKYYHTNKGITYSTWTSYFGTNNDDRFLKMSDKDWLYIFKDGYWNTWKADLIESQTFANILVDWVFISGIWGIKFPQRLLGVTSDGIVGENTLKALNDQKERFAQKLYDRRIKQFKDIAKKDLSQRVFLRGWLNRIDSLKDFNLNQS